MNKYLSAARSEDQKIDSNYVRHLFMMAVESMDQTLLEHLLMDNKIYFGYMSKWQALHWFYNKLMKYNSENFRILYNRGISLDFFPGEEVHEFFIDKITPEGEKSAPTLLENDHNKNNTATIICVVLQYEGMRISDIRIPKSYFPIELLRKHQNEN